MHSVRHMNKIDEILDGCGFPGQRFEHQAQLISAMLMSSEKPLAGCIGQQYSPPPEHDFPMLILATDVRIIAFVSNTDVEDDSPYRPLKHPYNHIDEIELFEGERADGELRIRYKGNRRVVIYNKVVSSLQSMKDQITQLNNEITIRQTSVPMQEVFSKKERILHKTFRWRIKIRKFVASPTLTILLNILLAIAVIAQDVALIVGSANESHP